MSLIHMVLSECFHVLSVRSCEELTGVSEKELAELTTGLKIGPKGRFLKAVKRRRRVWLFFSSFYLIRI